jgi:pimeloyl-ACP methyl ester carboxylesterase
MEAAMEPVIMVPVRKGVELAVSASAGRSPALVFLHGGLGNRFNWRSQLDAARHQGWQTLAYDLGGHGDSSPYRRYSIGRHCRDLSRLLNHLSIDAPILCCHSYGVPIGLEWAAKNNATGLVLIAGGTHDLDPWWEMPLMTLMALGLRILFRLPGPQRWSQPLISAHRTPLIDRYFAENPIPTDQHSYKALQIFWDYDLFSRGNKGDVWTIPALIISGGRDPTFNFAMAEKLSSHFQHSRHLHFPEAGHIIMAEYPDALNQAISEWRVEITVSDVLS